MPKIQKRIRNWKEYNKSLKKRGTIIFSFDQKYLSELYYSGKQKRGGKKKYGKAMYEYLLTVKVLFRLPWRATAGLVEELFKKALSGKQIIVPNYAHTSREVNKLELKVKQYSPRKLKRMEIALDSTGIRVYKSSDWHQSRHGINNEHHSMDKWRKIHIALDLDTMQIQGMEYTPSTVNDCEVVPELTKKIDGKVKSIRADGAYDTKKTYKIINALGAKPIIPPHAGSRMQDELKRKPKRKDAYLLSRDEAIKVIRNHGDFFTGVKQWKIANNYHRRSLIESCMFRLKSSFGFHLQQKTEQGRRNEMIAKVNMLNLMASYGRAQYST
jgi:transposase